MFSILYLAIPTPVPSMILTMFFKLLVLCIRSLRIFLLFAPLNPEPRKLLSDEVVYQSGVPAPFR